MGHNGIGGMPHTVLEVKSEGLEGFTNKGCREMHITAAEDRLFR